LHVSATGSLARQRQSVVPPSSAQTHGPLHVPKAFVRWQAPGGGVSPSSARPLQSSSWPLHDSPAGSWAEQALQPPAASHSCVPEQVPNAFVRKHTREAPSSPARHVHDWLSGVQCPATQSKPSGHSVPVGQFRPQNRPPSSGRQAPGRPAQWASSPHGEQSVTPPTGTHTVDRPSGRK